jgi:hypothetical protein
VANASYFGLLQGRDILLRHTGRCRKVALEASDKIDMLVVTGERHFDGDILGAAVWSSALTPSEILAHSDAFFIRKPVSIALLAVGTLGLSRRRRG